MAFLERVRTNIDDVVSFGPQFLARHLSRFTGAKIARVNVRKYGHLYLRGAESDVLSIRQVLRDHEYELGEEGPVGERIERRYKAILADRKVPVVVDAGANIGAASLWFLEKYPFAEVVAVEPESDNVSVLRMNATDKSRLHVVASAIGSRKGFVSVNKCGLSWSAKTQRAESGIPVIPMADAFATVEKGCPFIAKIDIEGFESDLFSESTEWLDEVYVVYIEPHDWKFPGEMTSRTFMQALGKRDFEVFIRGELLVFVRTYG